MTNESTPGLGLAAAAVKRIPERWETLAQAFQAYQFPSENLPLVQRIVDSVGISHYEDIESRGYIKAIRLDGARTLTISYGYTYGFETEQDAIAAAGDVDREKLGKYWRINHPLNDVGEHHRGGYAASSDKKAPAVCPTCFMQLPASGVCDTCAA